jgi:hypothetical protein
MEELLIDVISFWMGIPFASPQTKRENSYDWRVGQARRPHLFNEDDLHDFNSIREMLLGVSPFKKQFHRHVPRKPRSSGWGPCLYAEVVF